MIKCQWLSGKPVRLSISGCVCVATSVFEHLNLFESCFLTVNNCLPGVVCFGVFPTFLLVDLVTEVKLSSNCLGWNVGVLLHLLEQLNGFKCNLCCLEATGTISLPQWPQEKKKIEFGFS